MTLKKIVQLIKEASPEIEIIYQTIKGIGFSRRKNLEEKDWRTAAIVDPET
jgi:hypothetical protein